MPSYYAIGVAALCVAIPPLIILYRILRVRVPGPLRPQTLLLGTFLDRKYIPSIFTRHRSLGDAPARNTGKYVKSRGTARQVSVCLPARCLVVLGSPHG